ncbi:hypothetical protein LMIY3S_00168 [Labrys miyagiensis]
MDSWTLDWSHGSVTVHAGAGAIGRTLFRLSDDREVEPFHEAPWIRTGETVEPGLRNLRGDWSCLPFGRVYGPDDRLVGSWKSLAEVPMPTSSSPLVESDFLLHGYSANSDWCLVSKTQHELVLALDYPTDSPIRCITRSVRPIEGKAGIDVSIKIEARRRCSRPYGFHPNFALHGAPGSFHIQPGPYEFGLTHPVDQGEARAEPNSRINSLSEVPLKAGGSDRFDRLPFADQREEIIQLCGIEGGVHLVDHHDNVAWDLSWDTTTLPSCLLWMSNRGRMSAPWNGRNLCVGVEPVASAFDLGSIIASAANPIAAAGIATAIAIAPEQPFAVSYRLVGHTLFG